jgi:hypothetical protein
MWQDSVNGSFELLGGLFILMHIVRLYREKKVRGVSPVAIMYMTFWGFWNLYYYPFLDQWQSMVGGCVIAMFNFVWVVMLIYYSYKEKTCQK